jgi:hypothetical protein
MLVAAHIKQRSQCTRREREDYRANIVAMCKLGCDELFERGYISAIKRQWTANRKKADTATEALQAYIDAVVGKDCAHWGKAQKYFAWHNRRHEVDLDA